MINLALINEVILLNYCQTYAAPPNHWVNRTTMGAALVAHYPERYAKEFEIGHINLKGIFLGTIAGAAIATGGAIVIGLLLSPNRPSNSVLISLFVEYMYRDTTALILSLLVDTTAIIIGGLVAAKISYSSPYKNAVIVGLIGSIISISMYSMYPITFYVINTIIAIPLALLGGHIAARKYA